MRMILIAMILVCGCKSEAAPTKKKPRKTQDAAVATKTNADDLPPAARTYIDELNADVAYLRSKWNGPTLADAKTPQEVEDRLRHLIDVDQTVRRSHKGLRELGLTDEQMQKAHVELARVAVTVDEPNTAELKAFVDARGWPTLSEYGTSVGENAFLIAQHADRDREFQRDVLVRLEELVAKKEVSPDQYAYLHDRVATADGRPQRFGTQGGCVPGGTWEPMPLEDPEKVDEFRANVGLTPLAEYKQFFAKMCP